MGTSYGSPLLISLIFGGFIGFNFSVRVSKTGTLLCPSMFYLESPGVYLSFLGGIATKLQCSIILL